jgi:hypothetical protein
MNCGAFMATLLCSVAAAQTEQQDYTSQLQKLTLLTDNKQYRAAIDGYTLLKAQPGTPGWLKAASEFEIAELHAVQQETDNADTALNRAVQLGYDDCLAPLAKTALGGMKIAEADLRELAWLKQEVQHAQHDGRMMVIENTNRLDSEATAIPQSQIPVRPTTSPGVLFWRQQLLLRQRSQKEFVMKADILRIQHATRMAIMRAAPPAAQIESARKARAVAELRTLEVRKRAFVPVTPMPDRPMPCSEWNLSSTK